MDSHGRRLSDGKRAADSEPGCFGLLTRHSVRTPEPGRKTIGDFLVVVNNQAEPADFVLPRPQSLPELPASEVGDRRGWRVRLDSAIPNLDGSQFGAKTLAEFVTVQAHSLVCLTPVPVDSAS